MRVRLAVPMIGVMLILLGTLNPMSAAASSVGWYVQYGEAGNGLCLDIANSSTSNYALLQEAACKVAGTSGSRNQQLRVDSLGLTTITVQHSNKCLDGYDGHYVRQNTCSGAASQQWYGTIVGYDPDGVSRPRWTFSNSQTGLCITGAAGGAGFAVYQSACGTSNQKQVWIARLSCVDCLAAVQTDPGQAGRKTV